MGTWGSGNFDNDGALDYVGDVMAGFTRTITDCFEDRETASLDEDGESVLMPTVAIILSLVEHCRAAPPKPDVVTEWSSKYLQIYDEEIDGLDPAPGYKEARRQVIETTFQQLQAKADEFWNNTGG